MNLQGNRITWLGHATFRIETKDGATIIRGSLGHGQSACARKAKSR